AAAGIAGGSPGLRRRPQARPGVRRPVGCGEILFVPAVRPGAGEAIEHHEFDATAGPARRLPVRGRPMIHATADVLVLGAGFAGSLMALVAHRIGLRTVLVEKGQHPRFAVGESSTPIANLVLEELARTYYLPRLFPLTKHGRWQAAYPHLAVGLKRGFT